MKLNVFLPLFFVHSAIAQTGLPKISEIFPTNSAPGSVISVRGVNFSQIPDSNVVYFGAVKAKVVLIGNNELKVEVPKNASTGRVSLTVNGKSAFSPQTFTASFPCGTQYRGRMWDAFESGTSYLNSDRTMRAGIVQDFNEDGKPDIVALRDGYSVTTFHILKNVSDSSKIVFKSTGNMATVFSTPYDLVAEDFNGDGKKDLIAIDYGIRCIFLFKNVSTSDSIKLEQQDRLFLNSNPNRLAVNDIDQDGKIDLVVSTSHLTLYFLNTSNKATIQFQQQERFGMFYADATVLEDINNDGKPDLISSAYNNSRFYVSKNTSEVGNIQFDFDKDDTLNVLYAPNNVSVHDLDGDGWKDIIVGYGSYSDNPGKLGARVTVFKNSPTGLTAPQHVPINDFALQLRIADMNGDGKPDIVTRNSFGFGVLFNISANGAIQFAPLQTISNSPTAFMSDFEVNDLNGDGKPDFVSFNNTTNDVIVKKNIADLAVTFSGTTHACVNGPVTVKFSTNSIPPYQLRFTDGSTSYDVTSNTDSFNLDLPQKTSRTLTLLSAKSGECPTKASGQNKVEIYPLPSAILTQKGTSLTVDLTGQLPWSFTYSDGENIYDSGTFQYSSSVTLSGLPAGKKYTLLSVTDAYCSQPDIVTGFEKNEVDAQVQLFPNPLRGGSLKVHSTKRLKLELFDALSVKKGEYALEPGTSEIDLEHLVPNFYLVKLTAEGQLPSSQKLIVE